MDGNRLLLAVIVIVIVAVAVFAVAASDMVLFETKSSWSRAAPAGGYGDLDMDGMVEYTSGGGESDVLYLIWYYHTVLPVDIDGDGMVGDDDINRVSAQWNMEGGVFWIPEDVYPDGKIDMADLTVISSFYGMDVSSSPLSYTRLAFIMQVYPSMSSASTSSMMSRGDVNDDGVLDITDALLIQEYAKGDIDRFPVQEDDNSPPVAVLDKSTYQGGSGEEIVFDASGSYDPDGDSLMYRFVFDVPASSDTSMDTGWQTSPTSSKAWTVPAGSSASGSITLYVSDGIVNATASAWITISQEADLPDARFTYTPASPSVNETVYLDASSSTEPSWNVEYKWWIDNIFKGTGKHVSHVFTTPGEHTVKLAVGSSSQTYDFDSQTVTVYPEGGAPDDDGFPALLALLSVFAAGAVGTVIYWRKK